jgi:uncharacterized protein with PIN domain
MFIKLNDNEALINRKEEVMQQRFCRCGFAVWVQYLLSDSDSQTVFWSTVHHNRRNLKRCPVCGAILSIDELR